METMRFKITGAAPFLMHNIRLGNPFNKYAQRLVELNTEKKRKGVDKLAVMEQMADVEWEGGLYHTETEEWELDFQGPFVPGATVRAALVAGAKMTRGGASVARAVIVPAMAFPLKYDGPKELEALRADKRYWDQRMVRVGQAKVPRTRPIFTGWTADIDISFDPKGIERAAILRYMTDAGQFHGYGTGRLLGFGRFVAQEIPVHRGTTRNRDNGMAVGIAK